MSDCIALANVVLLEVKKICQLLRNQSTSGMLEQYIGQCYIIVISKTKLTDVNFHKL